MTCVRSLIAALLIATALPAFAQSNGPPFAATSAPSSGGGGGGMNTAGSNGTALAFANLISAAGLATARHALGLDTVDSPTFTGLTVSGLGAGTFCVHSVNGVLGVAAADCGTGSGITQLTGGVTAGPGSGSQAATVVTNANLTGPITSTGNATAIASQTGSGSKFVVDTSPTLVTPVLGVATATSINKLTLTQPAGGSTLTIADGKTLTDTSGTGAVALKGAAGGGFAQAACGDLSNGATGCSTATGTSGATIPLLNGTNTFSGVQTFGNVFGGILTDSTTSRTLGATDCGQTINFTNAGAITVTTANLTVGCHVVVRQGGAGQITVAAGGGTTIVSSSSFTKTRAQYSKLGLSIIATTVTDIDGDGA